MTNQPKLYMSPAGHEHDNATKCPQKCSENTHCISYIDKLAVRMTQLGALVKIANPGWVGDKGMKKRVDEANAWGALLYYVAHTNAGGGRYSMTMCWSDAASKAKAEVFHKYRKCVSSHQVKVRTNLYEIRATKMPCLYDELFFHDNAEDCAWFHTVGMELMVEETAQALCELLGLTYAPPIVEKPKEQVFEVKAEPMAGDTVELNNGKLYVASTGDKAVVRTGTFYLYDGKEVNGRHRVTNTPDRVNKQPVASNVSGWVNLAEIGAGDSEPELPAIPSPAPKEHAMGDVVELNGGKLYNASTGAGGVVRTGTFYLYDGVKINGRYRVTNRADRVNKKPVEMYVSGWVEL